MDNILKYERLVCKIAQEYSFSSNFEDLKQEGMKGLIEAVNKYVPNPKTKFSTYATYWIKGSILKYLGSDRNIKISRDISLLRKKIDTYTEILKQKLGRTPSISELSFFMEEDEAKIIDAINSKVPVYSADYIVNQDEDGKDVCIYDTIPFYEPGYDEDILTLNSALEELPADERKIIELRYYQDMTQSEVSKILGTHQVDISRREDKILKKLRGNFVA